MNIFLLTKKYLGKNINFQKLQLLSILIYNFFNINCYLCWSCLFIYHTFQAPNVYYQEDMFTISDSILRYNENGKHDCIHPMPHCILHYLLPYLIGKRCNCPLNDFGRLHMYQFLLPISTLLRHSTS